LVKRPGPADLRDPEQNGGTFGRTLDLLQKKKRNLKENINRYLKIGAKIIGTRGPMTRFQLAEAEAAPPEHKESARPVDVVANEGNVNKNQGMMY